MSNFNFQLGFNWPATPQSGALPLKLALQTFDGTTQSGPNYNFTPQSDYVCFNALNMTSGANIKDYTITGGSITFSPVGSQPADSPFNLTSLQIGELGQAIGMTQSDPTLNGSGPYWAPVVPLMQVYNPGTYSFTVTLLVQKGSAQQTFVIDPEMIIESAG